MTWRILVTIAFWAVALMLGSVVLAIWSDTENMGVLNEHGGGFEYGEWRASVILWGTFAVLFLLCAVISSYRLLRSVWKRPQPNVNP